MKPGEKLLIIFFFLAIRLTGQERFIITWDYKDLSFSDFVVKAERQLPVKFFYMDSWIADLRLPSDASCISLRCILDNLFSGKKLFYVIDDFGHVIITGNSVVKEMDRSADINITTSSDKISPENVVSDLKNETANIVIGNPSDLNIPGNVDITGFIINRATRDPVQGANIWVQKLSAGTMTNEAGYFKLSLPRGFHQVRVSYIGMTEKRISLNLCGPGQMNVDLTPSTIKLNEVIVSTDKDNLLDRFEVGAEKINIATLKLLPTSMGESDLLKSLILIPGVKSVGEGSAGFNVRGGSADQNLILLYGSPIYNSSHFFGFFSSVNSDIIENVTLYKGGIPSKYGGRISSVLDIETKEGNMKEFAGDAGISPVTTYLSAAGPIIKDTLSYIFTGRTTYSNWIFGLIDDPAIHNSRATFYDLNGKLTFSPDRKNKLELSSYFSHDSFRFNSSTEYGYNNNIIALNFLHFFSNTFSSSFAINNSLYKYDITNRDVPSDSYILSHKLNSTGLKADFKKSSGKNEVNFGLDINAYRIIPESYLPAMDSSHVIPLVIEAERALEAAIYIEDKIDITNFLSANAGIRISSFLSFGPQSVLRYIPDLSKSNSTIEDTLYYKSGKIISKYGGPEFRASLNFRINDRNSIKINYNRTIQYLHLLSNTSSISPTDTWKLCDNYLKPEIGDQYALGFYKILLNSSMETSAEIYYKEMRNMVDFKGGTSLTNVENIEQKIINVKGKAYGLELSLKKTAGKVRYSLGYTYSRSFVKSQGKFKDEVINSGNWYPANYDRPNDLVITFQYLYSRRFSFMADYTYSTGRPVTYPISTYRIGDIQMVKYSARNKYRIPDYSRLDISCKVSGNLRSKKIAHPNLTFSVYNLLGRENAYSVYFKKEGQVIKGYILSVFGRAVPSVTFNFDF